MHLNSNRKLGVLHNPLIRSRFQFLLLSAISLLSIVSLFLQINCNQYLLGAYSMLTPVISTLY